MNISEAVVKAIQAHPETIRFLDWKSKAIYYKAATVPRDEMERKLARLILAVDREYLRILEANAARVPFGFWEAYEVDLRKHISAPLRGYIEQSFTNYSDFVNFIDRSGAVGDIDTAMTQAISDVARSIANNTRAQLEALISKGLTNEEIIDSIALRFSSGHAEQVAVTELTRAEAQFSEALSSRLAEQRVETNIRWLTSEDERVCPICAPLDHKIKAAGGWMSKGVLIPGPPAHPNCRCQTVVETKR